MSDIVSHGGPMAAYLREVGEDPGPSHGLEGLRGPSLAGLPDAGRPARPNLRSEPSHRTLIMADRASSKHSRFQALFSNAMSPRLSPRESSRFVDRFRYVICTSQLLSESIVNSDYQKRTNRAAAFQNDDGEQAQWDTRKAAKYWMGSGGCVLLVSLIISWALRAPDRGIPAQARSSAALVLSLVTALFLYAQARRAYTRRLHTWATTHIQNLVLHCQEFDSITYKIIQIIQEVELVSRGYKFGAAMPPIARIEANARQRRCIRLRTAVVSALNLVYTANGRACSTLENLTNMRDFNKLLDVYNIITNDEDDLSILCDEADGIAYLKALFQQMHARRRKLLCSLLAVQADGRPRDTRVWRVVAEELAALANLMANLVRQLEDTLSDDAHVLDPNQIAPLGASEEHVKIAERRRSQARGINNLSQSLRRTQAKMYILREESSRILQQSDIHTNARQELLDHYDSLGSDLQALLADWQDGRQILASKTPPITPVDDRCVDLADDHLSDSVQDLEVGSLVIRPNSLGFWGPRMSVYDASTASNLDKSSFTPLQDALREEVYEADTSAQPTSEVRSQLNRAERIALMRKERETKQARSEQRRLELQARQSLQGELKDVLTHRDRRALGLRLSVHNPRFSMQASSVGSDAANSPPLDIVDRKVSTSSQQSTATMNSGLGSSVFSDATYPI